RPEEGPRERHGIVAAERLLPHPAGIAVRGRHLRPAVRPLRDREQVAPKGLRYLLGVVARLGPDRGELDAAPHRPASLASSRSRTAGQSSSVIAYHAESRGPLGSIMCLRAIPSNRAPSASSEPRVCWFRASVLNSTRCIPQRSNACSRRRSFAST